MDVGWSWWSWGGGKGCYSRCWSWPLFGTSKVQPEPPPLKHPAPSEQTCHTSPTASRSQHPHPLQWLHAKLDHDAQWPSFRGKCEVFVSRTYLNTEQAPQKLHRIFRFFWDWFFGSFRNDGCEVPAKWNSNSIVWQIHMKQMVIWIFMNICYVYSCIQLYTTYNLMYHVLCTK